MCQTAVEGGLIGMDYMIGKNDNIMSQNHDEIYLYDKPFIPSKAEKIALLISYPMAFLYTYLLLPQYRESGWYTITAVFTALFCILAEVYYRRNKAAAESYIWLGCIAVIVASMIFRRNRVWGDSLAVLFIHFYAVYWILNRSGRLTEGQSGPFSPLDMVNGFFVFPFTHFFLRIKVLWTSVTEKIKKNSRRESRLSTIIAVLAGFVLFYAAGALLASADDEFNRMISGLIRYLSFDIYAEVPLRFVVSLPIGAYLYGLVIGTNREDPGMLRKKGEYWLQKSEELKKVPAKVWNLILGAFSLMYLMFFIIQGSYLFGAFSRTLPEGFTVAQYARKGFFELCWIMGINFLLIWLITRSSNADIRNDRTAMIMCSVLLAESLLFAVTAFSKLMLYISCFGFTPLRLQSAWLICVLFCGSILTLYSLWTRKRLFRIWICISGISLALMHLY
jgi:Ca2+/Na+ antiporter